MTDFAKNTELMLHFMKESDLPPIMAGVISSRTVDWDYALKERNMRDFERIGEEIRQKLTESQSRATHEAQIDLALRYWRQAWNAGLGAAWDDRKKHEKDEFTSILQDQFGFGG